jgi:hypothetical protein
MHPILNAYLIEALSADRRRAAERFRRTHPPADDGRQEQQAGDAHGLSPAEPVERRRLGSKDGHRRRFGLPARVQ